MAKKLSFLILMILLFLSSIVKARPVTSTIVPSSLIDPLASSSSEELSSQDEGECDGLGREECLIRRALVAHTDYIYTQDIKGP